MQKFKREVEVILMETNFLSGGTGLLHQDDKKITKGATYTFSRHFEALSSRHNSKANNHSNTRVNQCSRRHYYIIIFHQEQRTNLPPCLIQIGGLNYSRVGFR